MFNDLNRMFVVVVVHIHGFAFTYLIVLMFRLHLQFKTPCTGQARDSQGQDCRLESLDSPSGGRSLLCQSNRGVLGRQRRRSAHQECEGQNRCPVEFRAAEAL